MSARVMFLISELQRLLVGNESSIFAKVGKMKLEIMR